MELKIKEPITINVSNEPTICLNMIVKNESKIITRMLDTVVDIIDCYCICDTGSTDNTVEIIEQYFCSKGIPGKIIHKQFKNFAYNRSFALKEAAFMSDFALLLDADMKLVLTGFNKNMLNNGNDAFHLFQGSKDFYYNNCRFIRNNGQAKYQGVTHEYLDLPSHFKAEIIDKKYIFIDDIGDGGSKSNKFERDVELLLQGIKDEPDNERYYFYLANTYHDHGNFEDAIKYYTKRIEMGGWKQEVWYSYYKMGSAYKNLNKIGDAFNCWMEGYNFLPERLEGLYEMLHIYRNESKYKLFEMIYSSVDKVLKQKINRDGYLFLHNAVYTYKIQYEFSIVAFYLGIKNINNEMLSILNNSPNDNEIKNTLRNFKFYENKLTPRKIISFDEKKEFDINGTNILFNSSSSSMIHSPDGNGYIMNVRYVNYRIGEKGEYFDCDKYIITNNKYVKLNNNFEVVSSFFFNLDFIDSKYIGIEDVKIFSDCDNVIKFIGTGYNLETGQLGMVSNNYDIENKCLKPISLSQDFLKTNCEKNWTYFNLKNETYVVYNWFPLRVCKINQTNKLDLAFERKMPSMYRYVRGSTCGFYFLNETWFVGHLVSYEDPRCYYHVISVFDENMNLVRYSPPFTFEGTPIEFCLSIIVENDRVLINYSNWDRTTRVGIYDKKYIDNLLVDN